MCCGNNLLPKSFTSNRTVPGSAVQRSTPAGSPVKARSVAPGPTFTYRGSTALTVVSPVTGKRYRFEAYGAQLQVDARDRSWMSFVPNLKPA
jgi:hypothetical protein